MAPVRQKYDGLKIVSRFYSSLFLLSRNIIIAIALARMQLQI